MTSAEMLIDPASVRTVPIRNDFGNLKPLTASLKFEGLRRPITLWADGTLISGHRRLRAHLLLATDRPIPAVFVDTIEDAAKQLTADTEDPGLSLRMSWEEVCRLWSELRRLDGPARKARAAAARRRGAELRRLTMAGERPKGRHNYSIDYVLGVVGEPFGLSEATAQRVWAMYQMGLADDDRGGQARQALKDIDAGLASIWSCYSALTKGRPAPVRRQAPPLAAVIEPAPAVKQRAAWDRALPQLEGLTAGLVELGPPHPDVTWDQLNPVRNRLMAVRRDLEKMINKMKETHQS